MSSAREGKRIYRELTAEEKSRLKEARAKIQDELPELIERHRLAKAAAEEETFSGELRRRVHKGDRPITEIARQCGIEAIELDEFLTGERTLPSDVIDELVKVLGCRIASAE